MRTLLITRRMSPALAARVQESVSGQRSGVRRPSRLTPLLRLTTAACVLALLVLLVHGWRQRAAQLSSDRTELLTQLSTAQRSLGSDAAAQRLRVEAALVELAAEPPQPNLLPSELRSPEALSAALARPTLYLRGPLESLRRRDALAEVAHGSYPDAFVLCLLDPPERRTEKALRAKARAALTHSARSWAHVERLEPLLKVLPLLEPAWRERVEKTSGRPELASLRRLFSAAPVAAAERAAKARQLLAVVDEPGDLRTPAELDGERPHAVRIALTDLSRGKVELAYRGAVDPGWLSAATRAEYASGIDSCSLALDLRQALLAEPAPTRAP